MGEKLLSLQNLLDNLDKTKIMISPSLSMLLKCYVEDYPWRKRRLTCLVKIFGNESSQQEESIHFLWETNNLLNLQRILQITSACSYTFAEHILRKQRATQLLLQLPAKEERWKRAQSITGDHRGKGASETVIVSSSKVGKCLISATRRA